MDQAAASLRPDPAGHDDPETAVVERDIVAAVFGELRARERQALWQWAAERRPLAEIAHNLGISYTAVQQLLFRARRHAASVAARVAALLGVFQVGRVLRRASHAGQLAMVAAVVPVVLVSVPSSVSPNQAATSPTSHSVSFGRAPVGAAKSPKETAITAHATIATRGRSFTIRSTVSLPVPQAVPLPERAKKILDANLAGEALDQTLKQSLNYP